MPGSAKSQKDAAQSPLIATNAYLSWLSGQGPKVHIGVGCDYCGVRPILVSSLVLTLGDTNFTLLTEKT